MRKFIAWGLTAVFTVCFSFSTALASDYTDMVSPEHWAYNALEYAAENKILTGFDDNSIRPNDSLTRAQMAAVAVRLYGNGNKADISQFSDLIPSAWHYEYFREAYSMGVFLGDGNKMYPENNITRQEAFTVIGRILQLNIKGGATQFYDDYDIANWSKGYIKEMYELGYISGDTNNLINPSNNITRAELAQLIYNIDMKKNKDIKEWNEAVHPSSVSGTSNGSHAAGSGEKKENSTEVGYSDGDSYADDIFDD